jgi:hypothetical protein
VLFALGLVLLSAACARVDVASAAVMPETARALDTQESTPLCSPECELITAPSQAPDGAEYEGEGPEGGFGPEELREAYGLPEHGGKGITVAIVDDIGDPEAEYDLARYREEFDLPPCTKGDGCFHQVNEEGRETKPRYGSWSGEIALDMDMVSAGCPECNILLLEGQGRQGRMTAIATAVAMGADVVTNSWNFGFEEGNPANSEACLVGTCVTASEQHEADEELEFPGVPILFSGGDYGYAVRFPASSPDVVSVGGTALSRDPEEPRGWHEETWFNPSYGVDDKGRGGGGGCAVNEPKPTWETDPTCAGRVDNDVAAVADPATPVASYSVYTGWRLVGGTSASAPFVAGVEGLSSAGSRKAGAAAFWSAKAADSLFDVSEGRTGECTPPAADGYWCTAGVGYDAPTGWGTPDGPLELPSPPLVVTDPASSVSPRTAALDGRVDDEEVPGGTNCSFQVTSTSDASFSKPLAEVPCEPDPVEAGAAEATVEATATGLSPHTTYLFRAVGTNADGGPVYGQSRSFITPPEPPRVSIEAAVGITRDEADLRANVDNEGAPDGTACFFEVTTADDPKFQAPQTLPCEPGTVTGESAEQVGAKLTGLEQNSSYLYRVVVSSVGGAPPPSPSLELTTLPEPPLAITEGVTSITSSAARFFGVVNDEGDADGSACRFEVAAIADREFEFPLATIPCDEETVLGERAVEVAASVSGLKPETDYRYRVEATNRGGTTFGDSETFESAAAPVTRPAETGNGPGGTVIVVGPPDEFELARPGAGPATTVSTPPVAGPSVPSNAIRLGTPRSAAGTILVPVTVPGAGALIVTGGGIRWRKAAAVGAGTFTVRIVLTKAARRRAARHPIRLRLDVTFAPDGGTATTKSVPLVVDRS